MDNINIELVWINDGSDELNTTLLKKLLDNFSNTTRFTKVVYDENNGNKVINSRIDDKNQEDPMIIGEFNSGINVKFRELM